LISGGLNDISISDLRMNTKLNGFDKDKQEDVEYLEMFWNYLESLPNE